MKEDSDFQEGPFFLVVSPRSINLVWAINEHAAIIGASVDSPAKATYLGGLEDIQELFHLTAPAKADLRRDGRLRMLARTLRPRYRLELERLD